MTEGQITPEDWPDIEPVEETFEEAVAKLMGKERPVRSPFDGDDNRPHPPDSG